MGTSFNHRTCHVRYADLQWQKKCNGQKGSYGTCVNTLDDPVPT